MRQGGILKKKKEEDWAKGCPKCGAKLGSFKVCGTPPAPQVYECNKCGYRSDSLESKIRGWLKRRKPI